MRKSQRNLQFIAEAKIKKKRTGVQMKLLITNNYETLSQVTADLVLLKWAENRRVNLALTAGSSPKRAYEILAERLTQVTFDKSMAHFYNFDEVSLKGQEDGLTMQALKEELFHPLGIEAENIEVLHAGNYQEYDHQIAEDGGLDLVLMGIGGDGHFCGNLPNSQPSITAFIAYRLIQTMNCTHSLMTPRHTSRGKK